MKGKSKPQHHVSSLLAWLYEALLSHWPELSLCELTSTHAWWSDQGWWQNLFWEEGLEVRSSGLLACVQGRNYQIYYVSSIGHVGQETGAVREEHLKPYTSTEQGRPISREEWCRHVKKIYKEKGKKIHLPCSFLRLDLPSHLRTVAKTCKALVPVTSQTLPCWWITARKTSERMGHLSPSVPTAGQQDTLFMNMNN